MAGTINRVGEMVSTPVRPDSSIQQNRDKQSFNDVLEEIRNQPKLDSMLGLDLHRDINTLKADLMAGRKIAPAELLLYQIKVGQFGLRVELLSKVAEGFLSTVRKFQQGQ